MSIDNSERSKKRDHDSKVSKYSLSKGLIGGISSCLLNFQVTSKVILLELLVSISIFLLAKSIPVVGWVVSFFENVYDFVIDTIEWIISQVKELNHKGGRN
jgi:hypothetical protein